MKYFTKEVRIALVAIVGLVLLYFGMNFLKGQSLFASDNIYIVEFDNAEGLSGAAPIYADGYRIGTVLDTKYDYQRHIIVARADVDEALHLPVGTTAEINTDLMGNSRVNLILAGSPDNLLKPGDVIKGAVSEGAMGQVKAMLPALEQMLPKLDSILASINLLLADPAIAQTMHNTQTITSNLAVSTRELNKMLADLNQRIPGITEKTDQTLANTEKLTGNLAALDLAGTMAKVDRTLANVESLTKTLNSREGTVGLLLHDQGLYNNMTATMAAADSLLIDLKAHPKRYVHFSLFGRKDK
jgi:phospholipid/cholesterol/gamma-HCH transport system substrate-binding protein